MMRIAVATRSLLQPLRVAIDTAGTLGANGVQIDCRNELKPSELSETGRRQFRHELSERLMAVAALEFPMRRALSDEDALDARVAGLKAALDFAWSLGTPSVTGRIGRIPEDPQSPKFQLLVDVLNDLARHANRVGAIFALTPTIESVASLRQLLDRVQDGPVGVNFDPAGLLMSGVNPVEVYRAVHDRVLTVQVRDALRDVDGEGIEVPVGRGELAWDELLALLDDSAFSGWLITTRATGENRAGDIGRAVRFLREVGSGR